MPTQKQIDYFSPRAVWLIGNLLTDFPVLGELDAFAISGNFGHESGGFTMLQEIRPTVPGSRGGYGWPMWTGARRRAYEAYCARTGKDPASKEANYAWVWLELTGKAGKAYDESRAIGAVIAAKTLAAKVNAFEQAYERAGVKHYASRLAWAEIARDAWAKAGRPLPAPATPEAPHGGAVAESGPVAETSLVLGGDVATAAAKLASLSDADFNRITNALALAIVKRSGLDVAAKATTGEGEGMDTKKWFQSKGILGGIAAVGALIGPIFGLDLGTTNVNDTAVAINDLIAAIGAIVAIYGRMTAKTTIKA